MKNLIKSDREEALEGIFSYYEKLDAETQEATDDFLYPTEQRDDLLIKKVIDPKGSKDYRHKKKGQLFGLAKAFSKVTLTKAIFSVQSKFNKNVTTRKKNNF